jgi:TetR/AcrR family transcriptional repressor of nem operon
MNIGRPREFDTEQALEAAMMQFWRVGYEATSVQDLLKAMQLSKSSLYQTFGSTHQLFVRCLEYYQRSMAQSLNEQLNNARSARKFLERFLNGVVAEAALATDKKGCMLVNTTNELFQRDAEIADAVSAGTNNLAKVLSRAIERGQREGDFDPSVKTETLVSYVLTNVCGLRTMVKGGADEKALQSVIALIMNTLD